MLLFINIFFLLQMVHSSCFIFVEFNCEYKSPSSTYFSPALSYIHNVSTKQVITLFFKYTYIVCLLSLKRICIDLGKKKNYIKLIYAYKIINGKRKYNCIKFLLTCRCRNKKIFTTTRCKARNMLFINFSDVKMLYISIYKHLLKMHIAQICMEAIKCMNVYLLFLFIIMLIKIY